MIWVFATVVVIGLVVYNYGYMAAQVRHWKETIYV